MGQQCGNCRRDNVNWAQYCAHCGMQLSALETTAASPPQAISPASGDAAVPPRSSAGGILLTLAIIAMIGFGWLWVMMPASRRHPIPPTAVSTVPNEVHDPYGHHDVSGDHAIAQKTFQADDDIIDALFRLLSPQDVPIVVARLDDDRLSASGSPDDIASLDAFVRQLDSRDAAMRGRQLTTYHLPPDQAKALEDALEKARSRITVRRDGSALHVRASQAMHKSIDDLLQHIQPRMQTMVDISRRDY